MVWDWSHCLRWWSLALVALLALLTWPAGAQQQRQDLPESADPGVLDRQLQRGLQPRSARRPPTIRVPDRGQRPPEADRIHLRLSAVELIGANVFTIEQLRDAWAPLMGQEVTLDALFDVAETLTARYRSAGYLLSQVIVPAQEIRDGAIRLQVVEGYIGEVKVKSPPGAPEEAIQRYLAMLTAERPMSAATLERVLLLINDLPGIRAETVLSPSDNATGAAMLTLKVKQDRVSEFASVDNRGTVFLGPLQHTVGGEVNGVLLPEDRVSARLLTTSPTDELRFGELGYETTLAPTGDQLRLRLSHSATRPTATLRSLEVQGRGTTASLGVERPLLRSRAENLSLEGRFTFRNSETRLLSAAFSDDRTRSIALLGSYDFVDRIRGISAVQGGIWQGIDFFGASESGSTNLSRTNGRGDFTKLTLAGSRLQGLWGDVSLLTGFNAQYALSQLLAPEEFGVGGAQYGHAYDSAEISGDHGVAGMVEVQYGTAVPEGHLIRAWQVFGGYDGGLTWHIADSRTGRDSLASASTGIRFQLVESISASLEFALPLTAIPATQRDDDLRTFFSVSIRR